MGSIERSNRISNKFHGPFKWIVKHKMEKCGNCTGRIQCVRIALCSGGVEDHIGVFNKVFKKDCKKNKTAKEPNTVIRSVNKFLVEECRGSNTTDGFCPKLSQCVSHILKGCNVISPAPSKEEEEMVDEYTTRLKRCISCKFFTTCLGDAMHELRLTTSGLIGAYIKIFLHCWRYPKKIER